MSLKVKLISTISAFILVLSMLFVGVFAAQNVQLNVGGNVSFTASSVYAKITGSYVGTKEQPSTAKELTQIDIDADTTDGAVSMPDDWTSLPLNFDESASPITVTITIQNLAEDRAIAVSLTDNTDITGVNVARAYNSSSFSGNTTNQTISGGQSGTFTFTLTVSSQNNDITGTFDLDVSLTNAGQIESYNVEIDNSAFHDIPLYVKIDNNEEILLNQGDVITLNGSILSMSISSFSNINSVGDNILNQIELYAPDNPHSTLYGIAVDNYDVRYHYSASIDTAGDKIWLIESWAENFYLSEDGKVLNYIITKDCTLYFAII